MKRYNYELIRLVSKYYLDIEQYRIAFIDNGKDYYSITDNMVYKDEEGEIKFIFDRDSFVTKYYGDSLEELKAESADIHHITHDIPDGVEIKSCIISDIMDYMNGSYNIFKNKLPKPNTEEPYFVIYRKIEKNKIKYEMGIYTRIRNTDEDRLDNPCYWEGLNDMYEPIFDKDVLYWKKLK